MSIGQTAAVLSASAHGLGKHWGGLDQSHRRDFEKVHLFFVDLGPENPITYQSIVDLCFQPSLYIDHNPGQDFNRLIPSSTSTHRRIEKNR